MDKIKEINSDTWCLFDNKGNIAMICGLPQMYATEEEAENNKQWLEDELGVFLTVKKVRFG